ncbi:MAG: hypothetical protein Kow00129_01530 [Thermoleophilia bacterium]
MDDQAVELDVDGRLLQVCGACAMRRGEAEKSVARDKDEDLVHQAEARGRIVREIINRRREEEIQLEGLAEYLELLADYARKNSERVAELENELKQTRAELGLAQQTIRNLEAAMSRDPQTASPRSQEVSAQFPSPAPSLSLGSAEAFTLEEVRNVQRVFNSAPFTEKLRSVRRSLGRPIVHLDPVSDPERKVLVTVAWEIIWYQFLVDLSDSESGEPVGLFAEGMELDELDQRFLHGNAVLDEQGRIDASEIEFELVKSEGEVISDESPEQAALEDATEEVWDRQNTPEFRWDD